MQKNQIDPGSWQTLNRLLDEALELPAPALEPWLESLAPEYAALKPRLRRLLSRSALIETGEFLNTLPKFRLDESDGAPPRTEQPGDEVGQYRLLRELGSGGMGVVWLAEKTDGLITRPVALKLPHGAWKHAGLGERMARERAILASLAHPNIAHLYDAGITAAGQPYLAIEFVEGTRIDTYCRERGLDVRARLELFAQVARAVAYAHGKLIVHRDLKPANILVNAEGQVRLLDFGVAKLLEDGEARETRMTEMSGRALTPDYASPEQILGEPLTTASDVYSLGVILYELLTEQRPYKLQRDSRGALEEAILQADPAPPSAVADSARRKALSGDLDTVVLKALKKKGDERYPTVHALLEDIERHLASRPVLAQRDSRWYRAKKFIARNTLAVSAGAAIGLALLAGAIAATWQARIALAEKARAEEVQAFISDVFREADPAMQGEGKVLSAVELLLQAERRLHERRDAAPALRLEMLAIIGESLFGLQENKESARVLEEALRLQASLPSPDPMMKARLHLALSQADELLGNTDAAAAELERALTALTATREDTSAKWYVKAKLQEAALGIVRGRYPEAERAANEAIDVGTRTFGRRSSEVATGLQQQSHLFVLTRRRELSVAPAREAHEIMLELHASNLDHPKVIESAQYLGQALNSIGDFDGAAALYQDARTRAAHVFGESSRLFGEALSVAVPLEIEVGDLRAAIDDARRAVEIYLIEGTPGSATHAGRVRKLGNALLAARAGREALTQTELAMNLAIAAKSDLEAMHARGSFGMALAYEGRFAEADDMLRRSLEASAGKAARAHHIAQRHLGTSLRLQGKPAEALPWLEKATAEAAKQPGHRGDLAHGLLEAGLAALDLGDTPRARQLLAEADGHFKAVQKERMTPARADLLVGLARLEMAAGNRAAALPFLEKANEFWREFDGGNRAAAEAAEWLRRVRG